MAIKKFSHWKDLTEVVRTDTGQGYYVPVLWNLKHGTSDCLIAVNLSIYVAHVLVGQDPDLLEAKMQAVKHPTSGNEDTLPKTNIAPESRPLEKEIPIGNLHFWVLC